MAFPLSFRQKVWLERYNLVVLLRGKLPEGSPYFAYVEMTRQEYESLICNPANYQGAEKHGRVIIFGKGLPTEEQKSFMEEQYEFDHSAINW